MKAKPFMVTIPLIALTLIPAALWAQFGPVAPTPGIFSELKKGKPVILKDLGTVFELTVLESGPPTLGHEVVEVGNDYVALRDTAGAFEMRIPVYAIKSVSTLRGKNDWPVLTTPAPKK